MTKENLLSIDVTARDRSDFDRLFDAFLDGEDKVRAMIADNPQLLRATNYSDETVIHWFIVENDIEKVKLLYACGAEINPYALVEALSLGYETMCELLLCFGVKPNIDSCMREVLNPRLSRKLRHRLRTMFKAYGYPLIQHE